MKKQAKIDRMKYRIAEKKRQLELESDILYKIKYFFTLKWLFNKREKV